MGPPKKAGSGSTVKHIKHFFGVGGLILRKLDFAELSQKHHPGKSWDDLKPFQQVELISDAFQPRHLLLDPTCDYLKYWDLIILFALCYTAVVTPYEVAFLKTSFNPLFVFNRCIDLIFLKDMILQFFLKVQVQTQAGKVWISDAKEIRRLYLRGWFAIDFMSILPFDSVGLALQNPAIQKLKVIRIVRLLRLLKLVRILRASRIMKRWENRTSLSYSTQGLMRFTILLVICMHWMGCVWGMLGLLFATDLVCKDDGTYRIDSTTDGGSWITSRDWGPNSPCFHFDTYLASAHFAVMTITSIGYGDICPTRSEELAAGIICQLMGGLTWAYVIGSICGIISSSDPVRVAFEQSMDALNRMMSEQNINQTLRMKLREYLREQKYHNLLLRAREVANEFSTELQEELISETLTGAALLKVWYFKSAEKAFLVEISHQLEFMQHCPHEKIGGPGILSIMQRGSAIRNSRIILPGDYFGADMIVSSAWLAENSQAWALTYTEVLSLKREALNTVLGNHPTMEKTIRKASVSIAFRNAIRKLGKENTKLKMGLIDKHSVIGARIHNIFDQLCNNSPTKSLMGMLEEAEAAGPVDATDMPRKLPAHPEAEASSSDVTILNYRLDEIQSTLSKRMDRIEKSIATGNENLLSNMKDRMDSIDNLLTTLALRPTEQVSPKGVLPSLPNMPHSPNGA